MSAAEMPMGLALVICDTIIEDKTTGKKSLIGIFDRIQATTFPCTHPAMSIFVSLTGGRGKYPCEIVCRHGDSSSAMAFSAKGNIAMRDPGQVVDLLFQVKGVHFPQPGTYWVHFMVDEMPIMLRPLFISKLEPPKEKGAGGPAEGVPPPASGQS